MIYQGRPVLRQPFGARTASSAAAQACMNQSRPADILAAGRRLDWSRLLYGFVLAVSTLWIAGYFFPPERVQATKTTLRTILTKPGWSSREIQALRGVIRALRESSPQKK